MSKITERIAALTPEEREKLKDIIGGFLEIDRDRQEVFSALAVCCATQAKAYRENAESLRGVAGACDAIAENTEDVWNGSQKAVRKAEELVQNAQEAAVIAENNRGKAQEILDKAMLVHLQNVDMKNVRPS